MAFRPKDQIDRLLVQKYANERVDNNQFVSLVNPNEMMVAMRDYSEVQRNFMTLNNKLKNICQAVNTKAVAYKASRLPQPQMQ